VELELAAVRHVTKFVHLIEDHLSVVVAFILYTWQFPRFDTAPFLHLLGQAGSGKTRLLRVLNDLCYRSIPLSGGSSHSSLFRSVDLYRGTLCLDETDFSARNGEDFEIARALRGSFQKGFVYTRTQGGHDNWAPVSFDLFGPKVIAGLYPFSDIPLESRCVQIVMRSGVRPDLYPVSLPADYEEQCAGLREWLLSWRLKSHFEPLELLTLPGLDGRLQQVFGPLLSVLQSPKLRASLEAVAGRAQAELREARSESPDGAILAAMLRLSQQAGTLPARMYLQDIVREIPFSTNPVEGPTPTARMVSSFCQQFGLQPMKDRKGRWVLFDPAAHAQVLEQFALAAEGGEERAA
jgi:energy-coupling factor transporter ATP-binding protein EcfA2